MKVIPALMRLFSNKGRGEKRHCNIRKGRGCCFCDHKNGMQRGFCLRTFLSWNSNPKSRRPPAQGTVLCHLYPFCKPGILIPPLFTGMLNKMPWRWSACLAVTLPILLHRADSYGNRSQGQGSISQSEFGKRGCQCLIACTHRLD